MDDQHSLKENLLALFIGSGLVSLGVIFFNQAGLLTGGTAGLALFLQKITDYSFGTFFFILNLPFYGLAFLRMGWRFTLNTFIAVTTVSIAADHLPKLISINTIDPIYAALLGGALIGTGMLIIIRHKMSLGGFNILALYIQDRFGIRAGKVQMGLDFVIVFLSFFIVDLFTIALSIAGAVVLNLIIAFNHKPGRYDPKTA